MKERILIVLARGKSIGRKDFVVGEIHVGRLIEPGNLAVVAESDSKEEMEKVISTTYKEFSRSSVLTSPDTDVLGIWAKTDSKNN